jgi:hypothetical protein
MLRAVRLLRVGPNAARPKSTRLFPLQHWPHCSPSGESGCNATSRPHRALGNRDGWRACCKPTGPISARYAGGSRRFGQNDCRFAQEIIEAAASSGSAGRYHENRLSAPTDKPDVGLLRIRKNSCAPRPFVKVGTLHDGHCLSCYRKYPFKPAGSVPAGCCLEYASLSAGTLK